MNRKLARTSLLLSLAFVLFFQNEIVAQIETIENASLRPAAVAAVETKSVKEDIPEPLLEAGATETEVSLDKRKQIGSGPKNEITIWGGYSPDSTTALPSATTPDARFGVVGVSYARRFNNNDSVNLRYTAGIYPIASLSYPDGGVRKTATGFGFTPFGLQVNLRPRKKIQPFGGMNGGMIIFNKRVPNQFGTKYNFTVEIYGGVEFRVKENRSVSVGYKFFHISNAQRAQTNPSYDNNVFYAGYSFRF